MSDYDEIIESKSKPKENHFPKKDWKAEKISLFETANNAAVDTVYSGKNLRKYLETQSRFDKYSATNVLLIMSQKPEATQIKDYNSWQKAGVTVKKFEKSFSILEPGNEYKTESGEIRQNFNIKKMFDISQTTAEPEEKPEVHIDDKLLLKALIHKSPVPIQMADHLEFNRGAFYDHEKEILFVLRGMSAPDIFRSVSKELVFAELAKTRSDYRRSECEFPAYCASFILCQKNGIDTKDYDFSRILESIRSKEPAQIRAQLGEIRETAVNKGNKYSNTVIVASITTKIDKRHIPTHYKLNHRCGITKEISKNKTKTLSSHRTYPLLPQAKEIFLKEKADEESNERFFGNGYDKNDYVFKWPDGHRFSSDYISQHFTKIVRRNGLASITFHGLRHSCASMLVNDGFNPKDIQEWLGHSDVRTTMNIYGHLDSTRKKVVGEAISKKVAGLGGC